MFLGEGQVVTLQSFSISLQQSLWRGTRTAAARLRESFVTAFIWFFNSVLFFKVIILFIFSYPISYFPGPNPNPNIFSDLAILLLDSFYPKSSIFN
jgi:hypothetical protein